MNTRLLTFDEVSPRMLVAVVGGDDRELNFPDSDPRGWKSMIMYVREKTDKSLKLLSFDGEDVEVRRALDGKMRVWDLYDDSEIHLVLLSERVPDSLPMRFDSRSDDGAGNCRARVWFPAWTFERGAWGPEKGEYLGWKRGERDKKYDPKLFEEDESLYEEESFEEDESVDY